MLYFPDTGQDLDVQISLWMDQLRHFVCLRNTCGNGLALEHDGSFLSCDHDVRPKYRLGEITKTPLRDLL